MEHQRVPRILVIDDEKQIVTLIFRLLKRIDPILEIEVSYNGLDAIQKIAAFQPHLVITDFNLPGCNGLAICQHIRNNPDTKNTKIMVVSSEPTEELFKCLVDLQIDTVLPKPFDNNTFTLVVKRIL